MPATTVQKRTRTVKNNDGSTRETTQYEMTVPKDLAEAFDLEGDKLEWIAQDKDTFTLIRK